MLPTPAKAVILLAIALFLAFGAVEAGNQGSQKAGGGGNLLAVLKTLDLDAALFEAHGVNDERTLLLMDDDAMEKLGLDVGAQLRLRDYIAKSRGGGHDGGPLAALLAEAGVDPHELGPTLVARGIETAEDFLLLDEERLAAYFPDVIKLGVRLKMASFIAAKRGKQQPGEHTKKLDHGAIASTFASLLTAHEHAQAGHDTHVQDTAAIVADAIEKNNEQLLERVKALIQAAQLKAGTGASTLAPPPPRELASGGSSSGAAGRSLNANAASMWLEDDEGKLVLGVQGDTDLFRSGAARRDSAEHFFQRSKRAASAQLRPGSSFPLSVLCGFLAGRARDHRRASSWGRPRRPAVQRRDDRHDAVVRRQENLAGM